VVEPLSFGIFPLGLAGSPDGVASGPPDDFEQVAAAAAELQGDGPPIMPRMYVNWTGPGSTEAALRQVGELAGLPWDMVLCYRDPAGSVAEWVSFVSQVVAGHGHEFAAIQVTGEPNLAGVRFAADGAYPAVRETLVSGVLGAAAAKPQPPPPHRPLPATASAPLTPPAPPAAQVIAKIFDECYILPVLSGTLSHPPAEQPFKHHPRRCG